MTIIWMVLKFPLPQADKAEKKLLAIENAKTTTMEKKKKKGR